MTDPLDAAELAHRLVIAQGDDVRSRRVYLAEKAIRQAEQAARKKALEEAAQVCRNKLTPAPDSPTANIMRRVFDELASDIRALSEET